MDTTVTTATSTVNSTASGAVDTATQEAQQPTAAPATPATPAAPETAPVKPTPADLTAILEGDKALQSQFDKRVTKALETAKVKWEQEKNMTADELATKASREREEALAEREKAIKTRELRAEALSKLGEKGLPASLVESVSLTDEDTMAATLEQVEKAFRKSVEDAVNERLKGAPPKEQGAGSGVSAHVAQVRAAAGLKI